MLFFVIIGHQIPIVHLDILLIVIFWLRKIFNLVAYMNWDYELLTRSIHTHLFWIWNLTKLVEENTVGYFRFFYLVFLLIFINHFILLFFLRTLVLVCWEYYFVFEAPMLKILNFIGLIGYNAIFDGCLSEWSLFALAELSRTRNGKQTNFWSRRFLHCCWPIPRLEPNPPEIAIMRLKQTTFYKVLYVSRLGLV